MPPSPPFLAAIFILFQPFLFFPAFFIFIYFVSSRSLFF